jgi:hypothetical protein
MERQIRNWLLSGVLVSASLCVALVIGELALRLIGFSYPVFYTYDDIVGSALRPNAQGWHRTEGEALIRISTDGLRDREHSKTKPPNTFRIAVLGDSMAEALQVPLEATFWSIMEQRLKECRAFGARNVEVLNFGVAGYGTAQELLTLRHRVLDYAPDMVVLAFYPGNDVRNNSRDLEPMKLRPFFRLDNGVLVLNDGFLADPEYLSYRRTFEIRKIFFELRTFQLLRRAKAAIMQFTTSEERSSQVAKFEPGLNETIFLAPTSAAWVDAWEVTERLIVRMHDEVASMGARFLLVSIPIAIQTHPDPTVRGRFERDLDVRDLLYPENRILALAGKEKIDAVLLVQSFRSYAEKNQVYLHGFSNSALGSGHLNENGHRLAGELVSDHICRSR